jgi:hypothetical protein
LGEVKYAGYNSVSETLQERWRTISSIRLGSRKTNTTFNEGGPEAGKAFVVDFEGEPFIKRLGTVFSRPFLLSIREPVVVLVTLISR